MIQFSTLHYVTYAISVLFVFLLLKAIWKVLPQYFPRVGTFQLRLGEWKINFYIWLFKLFGYEEFQFNKNGLKVKILAKDRKEAYRKFKDYTKTNRRKKLYKF